MTPSGHIYDERGLLARQIKPHSREKAYDTFRYANTVSVAMSGKWKIWWLELFAGPGALHDAENDEFLPGSPVEALSVKMPFAGYSFGDINPACIASLRARVGDRPGVHIRCGDANDADHIKELISPIPDDALLIAYLDPEGLELKFETIRVLARHKRIDFLLNLPVLAVDRELSRDPNSPKVAAMLEHDKPGDLLRAEVPAHVAIREHVKTKLVDLGFRPPIGTQIRSLGRKVPQYDLLLVSRNPAAEMLYRKATAKRSSGQRSLELEGV